MTLCVHTIRVPVGKGRARRLGRIGDGITGPEVAPPCGDRCDVGDGSADARLRRESSLQPIEKRPPIPTTRIAVETDEMFM